MNYVPFVYLLKFLPTGELYVGSRTAKNCQITDLWTKYFSSSKVVKDLIKEHGKDAFVFEVRKTFETKTEAVEYEHRFLTKVNAMKNDKFLNRSNGKKSFVNGPHTEGSIAKIKATKGAKTQEEKDAIGAKISAKMKGKKRNPQSQETIDKRAATRNGKSQEELDAIYAKVGATMNEKSQEEKAKISAKISSANTGSKRTNEQRANMSTSMKGKKHKSPPPRSPEHCAKISEAKIGKKRKPFTEEHLANMSSAQRMRALLTLEKKVITHPTRYQTL